MNNYSTSFTFQISYAEAVKELSRDDQDVFLLALVRYGSYGEIPTDLPPYLMAMFKLAQPNIDASTKFHNAGKIGGRPQEVKESSDNKPINKGGYKGGLKTPVNKGDTKRERESERESEKEKIYKKEKIGNGVSKTEINKTEFLAYLEKFNKLFSREFEYLESRWIKYKTRRHRFSQEQILRSLDTMASQPFYRGDSRRGDGWRANPDFHLRNDENILRFLEDKPSDGERGESKTSSPRLQAILDKFQPKPHELKPTQSGKNQELPLGATSQGKESDHV